MPLPWVQRKREVLWEEVASLLTKGPWRQSSCDRTVCVCGGGVCPLLPGYQAPWLVPPRLIFNLSGLNTYLHVSEFCMETLNSIIQGFNQGWWMVLLDLKDAYLHVPIRGTLGLLS